MGKKFRSNAVHTPRQKFGVHGSDNRTTMDLLLYIDRHPDDCSPQLCDQLYMAGVAADNYGDSEQAGRLWGMLLQRDSRYLPEKRGLGPRREQDPRDSLAEVKNNFRDRHYRQDWEATVAAFKQLQRQQCPSPYNSNPFNGNGHGRPHSYSRINS
jgi:hypothetical protein